MQYVFFCVYRLADLNSDEIDISRGISVVFCYKRKDINFSVQVIVTH